MVGRADDGDDGRDLRGTYGLVVGVGWAKRCTGKLERRGLVKSMCSES